MGDLRECYRGDVAAAGRIVRGAAAQGGAARPAGRAPARKDLRHRRRDLRRFDAVGRGRRVERRLFGSRIRAGSTRGRPLRRWLLGGGRRRGARGRGVLGRAASARRSTQAASWPSASPRDAVRWRRQTTARTARRSPSCATASPRGFNVRTCRRRRAVAAAQSPPARRAAGGGARVGDTTRRRSPSATTITSSPRRAVISKSDSVSVSGVCVPSRRRVVKF